MAHIATEEMQKVEEAVQKKQQWMHEQLQKCENLPKSTDPPVTVAQISAETKVHILLVDVCAYIICVFVQLLSTTCDPIVNKPKPKVEPPKEEAKKDENKKEEEQNEKKENNPDQPGPEQNGAAQNPTAPDDASQSTNDNPAKENTTNATPNDSAMDVD